MKIVSIVEGDGDVLAVPLLLRRLLSEAGVSGVTVDTPIRLPRSKIVQAAELKRYVQLALRRTGCAAIILVFDGDDDCPKELGPTVEGWVRQEAQGKASAVVLAHREYEAWLLGAIESLRGKRGIRPNAAAHPRPEEPRDAKGQLSRRMERGRSYVETADQPAFTSLFDMPAAHARCRSFRRMTAAVGSLLRGMGIDTGTWPPTTWLGPPETPCDDPRPGSRRGRR